MSSIFLVFWLIFFIDLFFQASWSDEENAVMLRLSKKHMDIDMGLIKITYWMYYWYVYLLMIMDGYNILITVSFCRHTIVDS